MSSNWKAKEGLVSHKKNFSFTVNIDPSDVTSIKKFVTNEVHFYNQCIELIGAAFHRNSDILKDLNDKHFEIFGLCKELNFDIYNFNKNKQSLPDKLKKFENDINELSKDFKYLFSSNINANIAKSTKRRIAFSVLKFFSTQAKTKDVNAVKGTDDSIEYKVPYQTLTTTSDFNKKHIQIERNSCLLKYDDKEEITYVYTPYTKNPFIIEGENIIKNTQWNYIIIRPEKLLTSTNTPWILDFKTMDRNQYMLKFIDRKGKSSIFEIGKRL